MSNVEDRLQKLVNVSRETIERLKKYELLLKKWNPAINLVSPSTLSDMWQRHFLDSAQLWHMVETNQTKWLDLGSGAGFPGLVLAIIAKEHSPDTIFQLVESDIRKSTFLLNVARETELSVEITSQRIENTPNSGASIITARALAPLGRLIEYAQPHTTQGATMLFLKGRNFENELTEARKYWKFDLQTLPSLTDSEAAILKIENVSRV